MDNIRTNISGEEGNRAQARSPPSSVESDYERGSLFGENKDFLLAGKTDFADLPIFADKDGRVLRLGFALFPAAFAFRHRILVLLYGGFAAVDRLLIFFGLQRE